MNAVSKRYPALTLLDALDGEFEAAIAHVARLCARNGALAADLLDQHQWSAYELALAKADLLAARTCIEAGGNTAPLDAALGQAFAADAIVGTLARLDAIALATDLDASGLRTIAAGDALASLRRAASGPVALGALGEAVCQLSGELADVPMDEPTALARDMFRRFAADVVLPLAEQIHRQDLTVPDSLLDALRAMGVFGLSIPEEHGGSAPAGQDKIGRAHV